MKRRFARFSLTLSLPLLVCAACGEPSEDEPKALYEEPDVEPETAMADFSVTIDTGHPQLDAVELALAPSTEPASVERGEGELALEVRVKAMPNRPEILWVELFFANEGETGLRDLELTVEGVEGADGFYNIQANPYGELATDDQIPLGGMVRAGVESLILGVPRTGGEVRLDLALEGVTTTREARRAAPIEVSPEGDEVWLVSPDADAVHVIDTATDTLVDTITLAGAHPSSLSISTDGKFVLVAAPWTNEVHVIDRASREILTSFGEAEGIAREPRYLSFSPEGSRVVVSSYVGDALTVIERRGDSFEVAGSVGLGRRPEALSISPDGRHAFVAHKLPRGPVIDNEAWVSVVDLDALEPVGEPTFKDIFNLDTAHCLADVFGVSASRMTAEGVRTAVAGAFLSPSGNTAWAPGAALAAAPVLERGPNPTFESESFTVSPGEIAPAVYMLYDTRVAEQTHAHINPGGVERPTTYSYMACAMNDSEIEMNVGLEVPGQDNLRAPRFAAFPTGITGLYDSGPSRFVTFSEGGRLAFGLSYVSDQILVFEANTFHTLSQAPLDLSGSQPIGLAFTPEGDKGYVVYENSMFVSVLDSSSYAEPEALPIAQQVPYDYREVPELGTGGQNLLGSQFLIRDISGLPAEPELSEVAQITLGDDPMDPQLRRGKVLFNSANPNKHPELAPVNMTSCYNCHPEGGSDGSVWVTMEGERRTMSLYGGVAGRGWLHASGTHVDAHEFIEIVATERLGATLTPEDLDAFAAYLAEGIAPLQPPVVDEELAARGEELFMANCVGCHQGDKRTSGVPDPDNPWGGGSEAGPLLFDVGTAIDNANAGLPTFFESILPVGDAEILSLTRGDRDLGEGDPLQVLLDFRQRPNRAAGSLKAPSLAGLWDQTLYFHDGRFVDLAEVVDYFDEQLGLGLDAQDQAALVEYLRTL